MAQVTGSVKKVELLEQRDGSTPPYAVSIDGIGLLLSADCPSGVPERGMMIKADVNTIWRDKKRPVFWIGFWARL